MKVRIVKASVYLLTMILIVGCKTDYIPLDSFNEQMKDVDAVELKTVNTKGPMGDVVSYKTYPIEYIKCVDKGDNPVLLKNSPSIEIRFTEKNNKSTTFYFDQIYIKDSTVIGDGSRFTSHVRAIPIKEIKLIEVQDGRKKFIYVENAK